MATAVERVTGRGLVLRLGVVEALAGKQLPAVQIARALDVGFRQVQVRFALADRRARHL